MKKNFRMLAMMLAFVLVLVSCKPAANDEKPADDAEETEVSETSEGGEETSTGGINSKEDFLKQQEELANIEHEGDPIEGGTFRVGLVTDSPFKGIFHDILSTDSIDSDMTGPTMNTALETGEDFKLLPSEALDIQFDPEAKTVTFVIQDGFKWNDGTDVVAKDIWYNYYVICHPDYTGVRYNKDMENIVGASEFNAGEADDISGITMPDDKTVVVEFKEFYPSIQFGSGIWANPINYEYVKDIPVKELEESDQIRQKPMSAGPFVLDKLVAGESAEFVANEHFWGGKPHVDRVVFEVVPVSNVIASLKAGKYDMLNSVPSSVTDELDNIEGYTVYTAPALYYSYTAFKLGKWDADAGEIVVDDTMKMANVNLRKAIALAVDLDAISKEFYKGVQTPAKGIMTPSHFNYHNFEGKGHGYDPEEAKRLLDEAGYVDVDGDGFREDPEGNELVINLAAMSGGEVQEPIVQYKLQKFEEIGLNVQLTSGRLIEFNSFYDKVEADDPEIDMFDAAWGVGTNPDPNETYGRRAPFNMGRYINDDIEDALNRIASNEAFDDDFRAQAYKDFEKAVFDAVSVIPTFNREAKDIINKRVKRWDASYGFDNDKPLFRWSDIELTADAPLTK